MGPSRATWLVRYRWWIVAAWVTCAVVLSLAVPRPDPAANELRTFLPDDAPSLLAADALQRRFPGSAGLSQAVVIAERPANVTGSAPACGQFDRLGPADLAALDLLARLLAAPLPQDLAERLDIRRLSVRGPGSFPVLVQPNPLVSDDGRAAAVVVEVPANFITLRSAAVVDYVRRTIDEHRNSLPVGLDVAVTGSAGFGRDYAAASDRSYARTLWVTVGAVLLILLLVFRAPLAAGVLLGAVGLAAVVAHCVLAAGSNLGLHVGTAERIFVFVLLYGVGVDYSLLYFSRLRELLSDGRAPEASAAEAWSASAPAIGASAATDIIGLAMLAAASYKVFRTAGCAVPIGLAIALAAALTLVPAAAAILRGKLFWPGSTIGVGSQKLWPAVARAVTKRPRLTMAVTLAALALPAIFGLRVNYVYDALTGLKESYGSARGMAMSRRHWPVGYTSPTTLLLEAQSEQAKEDWPAIVAAVTSRIEQAGGVADVRSLTQPLGRAGRTAMTELLLTAARDQIRAEYLSADGSASRLVVIMDRPGFSNQAMATLAAVRSMCQTGLPEGIAVRLAGPTAEMADIREITRRDFRLVAALVLAVVLAIVWGLLRDAWLSAFLVAATILSYLATLGIAGLVLTGMGGAEGLDWKVEVFLFVVLVAVGQDYNIFLAARLAEESRTPAVPEAAKVAVVRTGRIISSAGLIMAATLGSLMAGDILLLTQLGFALALGMLLDTFVVRPLLVPAFAVLTGRTGRPLGRRH